MKRLIVVLLLSIFLGLEMPAIESEASGKLDVVASIVPLGDFCQKIGGERVSVMVLIPPGASPHVFEPKPSDISRIERARIFFQIGAGLEFWAKRLIHSKPSSRLMTVTLSEGVELLGPKGHHITDRENNGAEDKDHTHTEGNPHIWLDPLLAKKICKDIGNAMVKADPGGIDYYKKRLINYLKELDELHRDIEKRVKEFRIKKYVAFHPAFAYFSKRYGLEEVGIIVESPGREPSPAHLMKIVNTIREDGIKAVFAEPQINPKTAEVIAKEAGCNVLILDPIGGRPPYGNDYLSLMRYNISVMERAMR